MGCNNCSSGDGSLPAGCKNNGWCRKGGCGKLDTYDWLSNIFYDDQAVRPGFVEVKFKGTRKHFYKAENLNEIETGDLVVVDCQPGHDVGMVSLKGDLVELQMKKQRVKPNSDEILRVLRKASEYDLTRYEEGKAQEYTTMLQARHIALDLGLSMKISDVEYQGDKTKAIFYYTAEGRVDFRELIKVLARTFRVKIEMKQIGLRQEAGRLGGIGSCGRELCCSTWLTDFDSVSITAARYQNLFLNPLKLSGQCGRLKCCLNYELDVYLEALEQFPDENTILKTEKGDAKIFKTDILKKLVWFFHPSDQLLTLYPLTLEAIASIKEMNKKRTYPSDLNSFMEVEKKEENVHEFVDAVGEESLNRFDQSKKRKKKKKKRKPGGAPGGNVPQQDNTSKQPPKGGRK